MLVFFHKAVTKQWVRKQAKQATLSGLPQDNYAVEIEYEELNVGNFTFTSGVNKYLKFEIVDKNASSSGYTLVLDYNKLAIVPVTPNQILVEVENLLPSASKPPYCLLNNDDPNLIGDQGHVLLSDSIGDFIKYLVNVPSGGPWNMSVGVKKWNSRCIFPLKLPQEGNVNVCIPQDSFSLSIQYTEFNVDSYAFYNGENKLLRFEIVGKNLDSTSYSLILDDIKFTQEIIISDKFFV